MSKNEAQENTKPEARCFRLIGPTAQRRAAEIHAQTKHRFGFGYVKRKGEEKPTGGCDAAE